ncbi:MAG: hypothetical protein FWF12_00220 [Betaproteobacteria bacterium]|nr:hypothetical protein [Betaproteobacteria bacterium]
MGTQSVTAVYGEYDDTLVRMCHQCDGSPSEHGLELAEFLDGKKFVDGFGFGEERENTFNGEGDLAAQIVAHFKKGPGGVYLIADECFGEEFSYHIRLIVDYLEITVIDRDGLDIFTGNVAEFKFWCQEAKAK